MALKLPVGQKRLTNVAVVRRWIASGSICFGDVESGSTVRALEKKLVCGCQVP